MCPAKVSSNQAVSALGLRVGSRRASTWDGYRPGEGDPELAWPTPVGSLGACHALELGFVFDTLGTGSAMAGEDAPQHLADQMHRAWVAFARDGDPGWTAWTPDLAAVMIFDVESEVVNGARADELALWVSNIATID